MPRPKASVWRERKRRSPKQSMKANETRGYPSGKCQRKTANEVSTKTKPKKVKLVAGVWRKFKEWWDMHKRKEVEEKTRESVLGRLAELKKETSEQPRKPLVPKKQRGPELD